MINAILYVNRIGYQWPMLPINFPPWRTVYNYYWHWKGEGLCKRINAVQMKLVRKKAGRHEQPRAAVINSQSVKTSKGGEERDVDVLGLVLLVVHSASLQDAAEGLGDLEKKVLDCLKRNLHNRWCHLKLICADGAYASIVETVQNQVDWLLEIVKCSDDVKGFQVLPHRWVVERSFGWLGRYRCLTCNYEHATSSSKSMVYIISIRRMLRLVTTCPWPPWKNCFYAGS